MSKWSRLVECESHRECRRSQVSVGQSASQSGRGTLTGIQNNDIIPKIELLQQAVASSKLKHNRFHSEFSVRVVRLTYRSRG